METYMVLIIFMTAQLSARPCRVFCDAKDQGSFMAGGSVVTAPGTYRGNEDPSDKAGQTLHGDHAYVFYQKPTRAHRTALVFLHGAGQSGKTWETTPDGRDGFQNIFLEKGYATYIVDQPRRGRAGRSTTSQTISAQPDDQLWYNNFRIGQWPQKFDNAAVKDDAAWRGQFFRQMTPNTGDFDNGVVSDAMAAVFDKAGDGVLINGIPVGGVLDADTASKLGIGCVSNSHRTGQLLIPRRRSAAARRDDEPFRCRHGGFRQTDHEADAHPTLVGW